VIDLGPSARGATGIQFTPVTRDALEEALNRTIDLWPDRTAWRALQSSAMATDVSWDQPAQSFESLYSGLLSKK
jgi:starch synthase